MNEVLKYMKGVVEGHDGLMPFARWLRDNDAAVQGLCSRGSYLRLKNNPIPEFRSILTENAVDFTDSPDAYLPREPSDFKWIKSEWLTEKVFPYRQSPTKLRIAGNTNVDELLHMIDIKQTGDELWRFSSPSHTWERKSGRGGIALVRDGQVIYAIITMMN